MTKKRKKGRGVSPPWDIIYEMGLQKEIQDSIDKKKDLLMDYFNPKTQKQTTNNRVAEFVQEMIDKGRLHKMDKFKNGMYIGVTKGGLRDVILKDLEKKYGAKFREAYSYKRLGKTINVKAHIKVPFTKEEDNIIRTALAANVDRKKIAEQLGRTRKSLKDRIYRVTGLRKAQEKQLKQKQANKA